MNELVSDHTITLQLLDSAVGSAVQSWKFSHQPRITIGRSESNDIVLADRQVSREHIELRQTNNQWVLKSIGRNGTRIGGQEISEKILWDGCTFQIGNSGPSFKFVMQSESDNPTATIEFDDDEDDFSFLQIDQHRKAEEVEKIMEGETFQQLRKQIENLKDESTKHHD